MCANRMRFNCLLMLLASIYFISTVLLINIGQTVLCVATVCVSDLWLYAEKYWSEKSKWMNDTSNLPEQSQDKLRTVSACVEMSHLSAQFAQFWNAGISRDDQFVGPNQIQSMICSVQLDLWFGFISTWIACDFFCVGSTQVQIAANIFFFVRDHWSLTKKKME